MNSPDTEGHHTSCAVHGGDPCDCKSNIITELYKAAKPYAPGVGQVRFRVAQDTLGMPALGSEVIPEVQLPDGSWITLRGVCSATIEIHPHQIVTAKVVLELGALNVTAHPEFDNWKANELKEALARYPLGPDLTITKALALALLGE